MLRIIVNKSHHEKTCLRSFLTSEDIDQSVHQFVMKGGISYLLYRTLGQILPFKEDLYRYKRERKF